MTRILIPQLNGCDTESNLPPDEIVELINQGTYQIEGPSARLYLERQCAREQRGDVIVSLLPDGRTYPRLEVV